MLPALQMHFAHKQTFLTFPVSLFVLFFSLFIMGKRRSNNFFFAPVEFIKTHIPTYGAMGQSWKASRLTLEAESPGSRVENRAVGKYV